MKEQELPESLGKKPQIQYLLYVMKENQVYSFNVSLMSINQHTSISADNLNTGRIRVISRGKKIS